MPDGSEIPFIDRDLLLAAIYKAHTDTGSDFGITLLVGGQWITGMTVTGRAWFEHTAQQMDTAFDGAGTAMRTVGRMVYPAESEIDAGVADPIPEETDICYLHLRAARRLRDTGGWGPEQGCWLRVRLSEVQAWCMGNFTPEGMDGGFDALPPPEG